MLSKLAEEFEARNIFLIAVGNDTGTQLTGIRLLVQQLSSLIAIRRAGIAIFLFPVQVQECVSVLC